MSLNKNMQKSIEWLDGLSLNANSVNTEILLHIEINQSCKNPDDAALMFTFTAIRLGISQYICLIRQTNGRV